MTGWRLGYLAAHPDIAFACEKIQGQFTSGANAMTQKAAVTALGDDLTETYVMRDAFLKRRALMLEELGKIDGLIINEPEGAFYVYPDVSAYFGKSFEGKRIENATDLCFYLLNHAYVTMVSGAAFGTPNYVRISYAASIDDLTEACKRIKNALEELT
jgi:aspartate aminotransferase